MILSVAAVLTHLASTILEHCQMGQLGTIITQMKTYCCAFFAIFFLMAAKSALAQGDTNVVRGKTIIHNDGTRTESISDPNTRQLEQRTFDANEVLILRRLYQLNERSLPVMGNIYDGAGNLQARSQSFFDAFGRLQEERVSNLQGEVFQQILHEYDTKGEAKQPKVINYKVNSPTMRPALLDLTSYQRNQNDPNPSTTGASGSGAVKAPVNLDKPASSATPNAGATPPPTATEEPKKGFFSRLFKKKDG